MKRKKRLPTGNRQAFWRVMNTDIFSYTGRKLKYFLWDATKWLRKYGKNLPREEKQFFFNKESYDYFDHRYLRTRRCERAIEIPIAKRWLEKLDPEALLEVGNVTGWYEKEFRKFYNIKTVVDRFEKAKNVINMDIQEYVPEKKFPAILSISTLEHIDGEQERRPDLMEKYGIPMRKNKFNSMGIEAIEHLYNNCLEKGGEMLITIPTGYSMLMDKAIFSRILFKKTKISEKKSKLIYMVRKDFWFWEECSEKDIKKVPYGDMEGASGLCFWILKK